MVLPVYAAYSSVRESWQAAKQIKAKKAQQHPVNDAIVINGDSIFF